jgi:signal transduction histidine kinase
MREMIYQVRYLGINDTQSKLEQERILILNDIFMLGSAIEVVVLIPTLITGDVQSLLFALLRLSLAVVFFTLQYFNQIILTRLITIGGLTVIITISLFTFGNGIVTSSYFMLHAVLVLVMFSQPIYRWTIILIGVLIYFTVSFYLDFYPNPSVITISLELFISLFTSILTITSFMVIRFVQVHRRTINELNQLASAIQQKNKELEVGKVAISKQQKILTQTNKELERFAYIASHDLKTPLRGITSFVNLIQRKLKNHPEKDVHEYLEYASNSAKQMHYLIQDILEYSRLGNKAMKLELVDLNIIAQTVITNLKNTIQERNAILEIQVLPIITSNKTQMQLLFQNLIENGLKYNDSTEPKVRISYEWNGMHAIKFQDNGIGISEVHYTKVFEMFQRLHGASEYQGSGIGLAICKKIVEQHQGTIQIDSEEKKGTTFTVRFSTEVNE